MNNEEDDNGFKEEGDILGVLGGSGGGGGGGGVFFLYIDGVHLAPTPAFLATASTLAAEDAAFGTDDVDWDSAAVLDDKKSAVVLPGCFKLSFVVVC